MAATYPSGIRAFPVYANGDQVTPATINDPDLEITALETGLLQGLAHDLVPDVTGNHRSLGTPGQEWYDLRVSHDAVVAGTLQVTGGVTLSGAVTLTALTVTGEALFGSNLTVNGDFRVLDKFSVVESTGTTSTQNLHVQGNIVATGTLNVAGVTTLGGSLHVVGPTTLDSTLTVEATADFLANLNVAGVTTLSGSVHIVGATTLDSTLTVFATANCLANLNVAGGFTVNGLVHVIGPTALDSTLTVGGTANVLGNLGVAGSVVVSGATQLLTTLDVRTAITSNGQAGVTVGTSATTLYTAALVNGADVGGMVLVCGTRVGNAAIQFVDWVLVMTDGAASLISGHSKGAADSRVYSWSGLNFQLTMGANSYHVTAFPTLVGTAGA